MLCVCNETSTISSSTISSNTISSSSSDACHLVAHEHASLAAQ